MSHLGGCKELRALLLLQRVWIVQSLSSLKLGKFVCKGMSKVRWSSVEGADTSRGYMVGSDVSSFHDYLDYQACV